MARTPVEGGPGYMVVFGKAGIDDDARGRLTRIAAKAGCDNLLRAELRAGQHLLTHALAIRLGATLGMRAGEVRAAAGDPTVAEAA